MTRKLPLRGLHCQRTPNRGLAPAANCFRRYAAVKCGVNTQAWVFQGALNLLLFCCIGLANQSFADDAPPRSLDPRLTIELFAEHPQVKTPTGIDVDADGRVWVIESNTHFRPDGYDGHPTDRLLILTDTDGDGRCDDVRTFADGFTFAMSVAVRPPWMEPIELTNDEIAALEDGPRQVVLCTRHDIYLLEDRDRDDVCDLQTPLIHLETENRYPHNGLAGLAFDAQGWMYFGIGQNHGQPYRMISHEAARREVAGTSSLSPAEHMAMSIQPSSGGEGWGEGDGSNAPAIAPHPGPLPHTATRTAIQTSSVGERELLQVFLATRKEVLLLEDTDGDEVCDRRTTLAHLDTAGNYPHNGLAGLAFDPAGWMYFGFGENLGEDYRLISLEGESAADANDAADEAGVITGGGEGGSIFRMRPDGTGLTRWSTGYWNPHASCTDAFGRLFTVDNDPDSRPPCRLIHVIEGGDSGYRFRNGRKGLHPFTAWNGEIPGTLPMVAGTGEAPSGLVACEHAAWPGDMQGNLLVGSWGDHRIDRFQLRPAGGSFESIPEPLIIGGENFRPVGVALAEDGSLYCSDWVLKDYNLHGQGRVWRIRPVDPNDTSADEPTLDDLAGTTDRAVLERGLLSAFLPARRLAARRLAESAPDVLVNLVRDTAASERSRFEAMSALVLHPDGNRTRVIKDYVPVDAVPYDSVQTLLALHFEEAPSVRQLLELIETPNTDTTDDDALLSPVYGVIGGPAMTDPQFILAGMQQLTPLLRVLGASQTESAVTVLNRVAAAGDPFVDSRLVTLLSQSLDEDQFDRTLRSDAEMSPRLTTLVLLGARQAFPKSTRCASAGLEARHAEVLRAAVQWVAEERLDSLRPNVEAALASDFATSDLFLATVAALELLDGKSPQDFDQTPAGQYILPLLRNENSPAAVQRVAIRLADPSDEAVKELLLSWVDHEDPVLRREVLLSMGEVADERFANVLTRIALDDNGDARMRALALDSLAVQLSASHGAEVRETLCMLLSDDSIEMELRRAAMRSLRELAATNTEVHDLLQSRPDEDPLISDPSGSQLNELAFRHELELEVSMLETDGLADAIENGERAFFHPTGAGCYRCHTVNGRGGSIGPDLSNIGRGTSLAKLVDSILNPSREVAPQFTNWQMATFGGDIHTGMIVLENEGRTAIGNAEGKIIELPTIDIEMRTPQPISVMPERLEQRMTRQEFRDLLAFLQSLGE